jgi:signal transduction histidine kinase
VSDQVAIALIGLGCSGALGAVGLALVRALGDRSVRGALLSVAVVSILAVLAGVVGTSQAMFLSRHDFGVVAIVSGVAGFVGLLVALLLARGLVRDVEQLRRAARDISATGVATGVRTGVSHAATHRRPPRPRTRELAEVLEELTRSGERLAAARDREHVLESSRRELIAWVSHDLRTPLAGLRAMAEALEDGVADDPQRYHRQIRREVARLSRMVDDLFELSRIQAGALVLSLEAVDLHDLISDVVSGTRPLADAGGVRLAADAAPITLDADAAGLGRVLANLVVNAIRHTPSDGAVEIVAAESHGEVVVSVSDRCGGLPAGDRERVFEPGWRGSEARTPEPDGGAGLGLAIARGIVEAHRGTILVRDGDGGCCFEVRLPRTPPATPPRGAVVRSPSPAL